MPASWARISSPSAPSTRSGTASRTIRRLAIVMSAERRRAEEDAHEHRKAEEEEQAGDAERQIPDAADAIGAEHTKAPAVLQTGDDEREGSDADEREADRARGGRVDHVHRAL